MTVSQEPTRNYSMPARLRNVAAIVLGLLATVLAPIVTGLLAIILASRGIEGDRKVGIWAMAVAVIGTIVGVVYFYIIRGNDLISFR
ncbi:hypothetical protein [Actinomadura sp. HBU206391]|uniref:hypothetical protein n=1 Tax=Actinomadura sp. HBU206391 TaxID=2731692 RepID=UPI0016501432|nr:hypothetical protein [Actinomadura sp. HBU206391]MBC6458976.1 hypothetical protein [Actinomadura sp. HBU206391]